jgi:hypothetical protein
LWASASRVVEAFAEGLGESVADRCEAVLLLIPHAWQASRWCLAEFLLAKQIGKTIFGVLVEPNAAVSRGMRTASALTTDSFLNNLFSEIR